MSGLVTPVILSGGSGVRLWPLSRPETPKQLIHLFESKRTLLQETALRIQHVERFAAPIVVGSEDQADAIEIQLMEIDVTPALVILEPVGRNTAAAIALAALVAPPESLLLVMPSDHMIADLPAFDAALRAALTLAERGFLVTFGIRPDRPETGYGYVELGSAIEEGSHRVAQFVEKPDCATAQGYIDGGGHLWNSGIFLFRADEILTALNVHASPILEAVQHSLAHRTSSPGRLQPHAAKFSAAPAAPIDRAVMEKADNVAVVPVEMGWSDVGSWDAYYDLHGKDHHGNVLVGKSVSVGSQSCLIRAGGQTIVALGVENLMVIENDGIILILPRGKGQRVREAYERLNPPTSPQTGRASTEHSLELIADRVSNPDDRDVATPCE